MGERRRASDICMPQYSLCMRCCFVVVVFGGGGGGVCMMSVMYISFL